MPKKYPRSISGKFSRNEGMLKLGELLAGLCYRSLYWILFSLAERLKEDSKKDFARKRVKLGGHLQRASGYIAAAAREISFAWQISEPYMYKVEELPEHLRPEGNQNRYFIVTLENEVRYLISFRADYPERTWIDKEKIPNTLHFSFSCTRDGLFGAFGRIEEREGVAILHAKEVESDKLPMWAKHALETV